MQEIKKDPSALFNIGYGLYVITSNDGTKDNGMIGNAVVQVTSSPERIAVTINKAAYSHGVIKENGKMNLNCLTVKAPFKVFEAFGFSSGRDKDKFAECDPPRSSNGLVYLPHYINSYISLDVEQYIDLGTHGMFICVVTESVVLSNDETMSYIYYHKNVKPKPKTEKKSGYVCTICGFIENSEELPDDYVCPICNHGREVFEPLDA